MSADLCPLALMSADLMSLWSSSLSPTADLLLSDEACDTSSDLMLAQMLQMQFDREFDEQLHREEKKFNGDSKGETLVGSEAADASAHAQLRVPSVHLLRELPHGSPL